MRSFGISRIPGALLRDFDLRMVQVLENGFDPPIDKGSSSCLTIGLFCLSHSI